MNENTGEILAVLRSRFDSLELAMSQRFADMKADLAQFVLQAVYDAHRAGDTERVAAMERRLDDVEEGSGTNWRTLAMIALPTLLSIISLFVVLSSSK